MRRTILALVGLFVGLGGFVAPAAASDEALGWWGGSVFYRDDNLQVRVRITRDVNDRLIGWLDFPELVYAGETVPIVEEEGHALFTVDYPFGLGEIPYVAEDPDTMVGTRQFMESTLTRIPPPPYRKAEVSFSSQTGTIPATLYTPRGAGPHPAIVIAAGSGNAERSAWSYSSWADYYARLGIAALIYDRTEDDRVLEDGTVVGIQLQAEEMADAVRFVQDRSNIDTRRVGVAGSSRGAWLAMYVAAEIENVAFVILSSGSPLTPAEQTIVEVRARVWNVTHDWELVSTAEAYMRLYFYVAETGRGWDILEEEIARIQGGPLHGILDEPRRETDLNWWGRNLSFRPDPLLARISAPVLGLWGGADLTTPHRVNAPLMESYLPGGADQLTVHTYPQADHRLELPLGETEDGAFHWFAVAPVQQDDIAPWLRANGIIR